MKTSSVLSKVEPEPDLYTDSDQKVPAPAPQHCLSLVKKWKHKLVPALFRIRIISPDPYYKLGWTVSNDADPNPTETIENRK